MTATTAGEHGLPSGFGFAARVVCRCDKGKARADAEGLKVAFRVADAEDLPFSDGRFEPHIVALFGSQAADIRCGEYLEVVIVRR